MVGERAPLACELHQGSPSGVCHLHIVEDLPTASPAPGRLQLAHCVGRRQRVARIVVQRFITFCLSEAGELGRDVWTLEAQAHQLFSAWCKVWLSQAQAVLGLVQDLDGWPDQARQLFLGWRTAWFSQGWRDARLGLCLWGRGPMHHRAGWGHGSCICGSCICSSSLQGSLCICGSCICRVRMDNIEDGSTLGNCICGSSGFFLRQIIPETYFRYMSVNLRQFWSIWVNLG